MQTQVKELSKLVQEQNQYLKSDNKFQPLQNFSLVGTKLNSKVIRSSQQSIDQQIEQQLKRTQSTIQVQENLVIQEQSWLIQQEFNKADQERQKKLEYKEKSTLKEDIYYNTSVDESCKLCSEGQNSLGQITDQNPFIDSKKVLNRKSEQIYGKFYSQTPQNNMNYQKQQSSRINLQNTCLNQRQQVQDFFRSKQNSISTRTLILVSAPNNVTQNTSRSNIKEQSNTMQQLNSRVQSQHKSIFNTQDIQKQGFRNQTKSLQTCHNSSNYYDMIQSEENTARIKTQPEKASIKTQRSKDYIKKQINSHFYQNAEDTPISSNYQNQSLEADSNLIQKSHRGGQQSIENSLFMETSRSKHRETINNPFSNQLISNTINNVQIEKQSVNQQEFNFNQSSPKNEILEIKQEDVSPQYNLSDGFTDEIQKQGSVTIINNIAENSKEDFLHNDTQTIIQEDQQCIGTNTYPEDISYVDALNNLAEKNWSNKNKFQIPISLLQSPNTQMNINKDLQNLYFNQAQLTIQSTRYGTPLKKTQTQPSQNIYKFQYINGNSQRPQTSISRYQSQGCRNKSFVFQPQDSYDQSEQNQVQPLKPKQFELLTSNKTKSKILSSVQQKQSQDAQILAKSSNLFHYIQQKCKETEINYLEEKVKQTYNTDDMIYQEYMNYIQRIRKEGQQQLDLNQLNKSKSSEFNIKKQLHKQPSKIEKCSQTVDQDSFNTEQIPQKPSLVKQRPLSSVSRPGTCLTPQSQNFSRRQITRKLKKYACKFQSVSQQFQKLQENINKIQHS